MAEYYGVRHLSPACAFYVREFLDRTKPKAVLIEGPSDLNDLIDGLCNHKVRLPAAILAYTTEAPVRTVMYPMAEFSPEYQAMVWAKRNSVPVGFCDLPSGSLLYRDEKSEENDEDEFRNKSSSAKKEKRKMELGVDSIEKFNLMMKKKEKEEKSKEMKEYFICYLQK